MYIVIITIKHIFYIVILRQVSAQLHGHVFYSQACPAPVVSKKKKKIYFDRPSGFNLPPNPNALQYYYFCGFDYYY